MINDKLIDVFLQNAEQEDLIRGIKEILNHFRIDSEYRSAELVNKLLESITGILNTIAQNTAPVDKIYKVLVSYLSASGSGSTNNGPTVVKERTKSHGSNDYADMESNISTLAGVLAELAKG